MKRRWPWLVAILFCSTLLGQQISPTLFNGLSWRLIGPFRGGRSVAVSGLSDGRTFFFGSVDGGVWKTSDAGTVWTPIFDGQAVASIGALAVAPSNENVLYAGTGETDIRSDLASGDGVYKSMDGGKSWKNAGLRETRQISRIVIDPADPNKVFVAALGHAYKGNTERGVYRTLNGGETWEKVLYKSPVPGAADLAIATDAPQILFASLWNAHRPTWSTYAPIEDVDNPGGSGLYRSTDSGATWAECSGHGLPGNATASGWGRVGVAIAPGSRGKRVYALIEAGKAEAEKSGLYRSDDGGENWALVNNDPRITSRAWYFNSITADPNNPDVVFIPNVALYKLSDAGKTLEIVRGAPGGDDYHQLWIDPKNSLRMVLGTDQGTTVSLNGGATWSSWYNQPTAQFYHVITDNAFPYNVYGSQQDSGTAATPSSTDHGEIDARDRFTVGGGESGYIAPDPKDPNIFYVSGTFGELNRFDRRTTQSQNIAPWPISGFGTEASKRKYRDPWTPVLLFSKSEPNALFLGTQFVMKTTDGGLHWQQISPDLTGAAKDAGEAKPITPLTAANAAERGYGMVYTIAPSPMDAKEIWAGSDTGLVHVTRDAGKTWTDVTPANVTVDGAAGKLPVWSKITQIEVSHFNAGEAYAAVDRHRLDDRRPYLFRTKDFGKSWEQITNGIAEHAFLNAVREDPVKAGLLYAATEFGVYVSFDDGSNWQSLQLNLPVTSVRDIALHGSDLIVATHGRSFWVLDDAAPLRQVSAATTGTILFKPSTAVRMTSDAFLGTPLPPEEPQAANPARGAYLDYVLEKPASGDVVLQILDGSGKEVRRYSSDDKPQPPPGRIPIAARWFPKPQVLSKEAGMHRFVWDLRFGRTGVKATGDDDEEGQSWMGPMVLPGAYTVKLTVDGRTLTQELNVTMDPRSVATPDELAQQFKLGQQVFEDSVRGKKGVTEAGALQKRLTEIKASLKPNQVALQTSVANMLQEVKDVLSGGKAGPEQGLQGSSAAMSITLNAIETADRTPPSQVSEAYQASLPVLNQQLTAWEALKGGPLPKLNEQLRNAGLTPVEVTVLERAAEDSLAR